MLYQEQQAATVDAGDFTSGDWRTRALNVEVEDTGNNGTLASNQITVSPGSYIVNAWAVAFQVGKHQTRLYDVTNSAVLAYGSIAKAGTTDDVHTTSTVTMLLEISTPTVIKLEHRCNNTNAGDGKGQSSPWATSIYSQVELIKI